MAPSPMLLEEHGSGAPSARPIRTLMPYLWPAGRTDLKRRVVIAMVCLILAKIATVAYPFFLGMAVDSLGKNTLAVALAVPLGLIGAYVLARILMQGFAQLRDAVFSKVSYHAVRQVAVQTFRHIHALSLRFHLERRTGGLSRVIDRGTKGIDTVLTFAIFSIFPTALELLLDGGIFLYKFNIWFAVATLVMVVAYIQFTFAITRWRIRFRREMNDSDTEANTKAVDSLLNYETVKYFNAEGHETRRFGVAMDSYAKASIKAQQSLAILNTGQAVIMALGMGAVLTLSVFAVRAGEISVGDMVLANSLLIQLYVPLNLLGTVYREIAQALVDMETMFSLLHQPQEVKDKENAEPLKVSGGTLRFEDVEFSYDTDRKILKKISFEVPAGKTVAVVGPSGAGKSTLSRILYRFYDIQSGRVTIDGQDIRDVTQDSLRASIGIVPQDTVLFNDTIHYNIAYGRIGANEEEILNAASMAQIDPFIRQLPAGYETMVGERGLKLSGGEKQRVAIARTLLKNPPILVLDEATSALDTHTEREIQSALKAVSRNRTTLVIAHRLSTIIDADEILVLEQGVIVERGRHEDLLTKNGVYASMWNRQREAADVRARLESVSDIADVRDMALDIQRLQSEKT